MNEELQQALAEFVKATITSFSQGKDFVLAQAPDVIQQLIRWHFWEALVLGVVLMLVCCAAWIGVRRLALSGVAAMNRGDDPFGWFMSCGFGAGGSMALTAVCIGKFLTVLQITVAPKVWLLEWAMAQVKS